MQTRKQSLLLAYCCPVAQPATIILHGIQRPYIHVVPAYILLRTDSISLTRRIPQSYLALRWKAFLNAFVIPRRSSEAGCSCSVASCLRCVWLCITCQRLDPSRYHVQEVSLTGTRPRRQSFLKPIWNSKAILRMERRFRGPHYRLAKVQT